MKKVFVGLGLLSVLALSACSSNQPIVIDGDKYSPDKTITVKGTGTSKIKADTGYLSVFVTVEKKDSKEAQKQVASTLNEIHKKLGKIGIDKENIESTNYTVDMMKDYTKRQEPFPIVGYRVQSGLNIKIDNVELISDVIDNVSGQEYVTVNNLVFDLSDKDKAKEEALADATKKAKEQSEQIAKSLGVKIVGVKNVDIIENFTENESYGRNLPFADMSVKEESASTKIAVGNVDSRATVEVKFLIE